MSRLDDGGPICRLMREPRTKHSDLRNAVTVIAIWAAVEDAAETGTRTLSTWEALEDIAEWVAADDAKP